MGQEWLNLKGSLKGHFCPKWISFAISWEFSLLLTNGNQLSLLLTNGNGRRGAIGSFVFPPTKKLYMARSINAMDILRWCSVLSSEKLGFHCNCSLIPLTPSPRFLLNFSFFSHFTSFNTMHWFSFSILIQWRKLIIPFVSFLGFFFSFDSVVKLMATHSNIIVWFSFFVYLFILMSG